MADSKIEEALIPCPVADCDIRIRLQYNASAEAFSFYHGEDLLLAAIVPNLYLVDALGEGEVMNVLGPIAMHAGQCARELHENR